MKLSELLKTDELKSFFNTKDDIVVRVANIDDVFVSLRMLKIDEVSVDLETMLTISIFVCSNCGQTSYGSDAMKTGNVSEFFGVKLTLEL